MISIQENVNLKPYNTFAIRARAKYLVPVTSEEQLIELIQSDIYKNNPVLVLGGGSNILFTKDFDGLVVRDELKGIEVVDKNDTHVTIKVAAGETWHGLVMHAVSNNWGGIENLSLIPGTVGAAPMQNIGAYGIEVKEVIISVDAIDRSTGKKRTFNRDECMFAYRESVFKHTLKEKYFISSVTLTLTTIDHRINISYGAIIDTLKQMNVTDATINDVAQAVISIRSSKLPDPKKIGNAGSFFKNPTIDIDQYHKLKLSFENIPGYTSDNQHIKVPAGWLIEQCGWKGKTFGDVGVHQHQALVLVNYANGNGDEILQLSKNIQSSVKEKFGIDLQAEVNII